MTQMPRPVRFSMELYFDDEVKRWGFDGEVRVGQQEPMGISGSSDTLRDAQRESLDALRVAFDSLREDGRLPSDPAEETVAAAR